MKTDWETVASEASKQLEAALKRIDALEEQLEASSAREDRRSKLIDRLLRRLAVA